MYMYLNVSIHKVNQSRISSLNLCLHYYFIVAYCLDRTLRLSVVFFPRIVVSKAFV